MLFHIKEKLVSLVLLGLRVLVGGRSGARIRYYLNPQFAPGIEKKGVDAIRNPPTAWAPPCCNTRRPQGVRFQSVTNCVTNRRIRMCPLFCSVYRIFDKFPDFVDVLRKSVINDTKVNMTIIMYYSVP